MPSSPETTDGPSAARPAAAEEQRKIFQVTELTRRIKETLEDAFGMLWIEGEVSNLRRPSSGHIYFTLKDSTAQLAAVFFRGYQRGTAAAELKDGMQLRVHGEVTVYERSGNYQVVVREVEAAGQGSLLEQFEKLKKKLAEEGLFAAERKQPIPMLPQHVGVVTSPTGAALRDILQVISRRFPNLHVLVAPVKVQGEGAAGMIARAIEFLNRRGDLDVLIVGRGGGSLEDLWCFNEEVVGRAIAASAIPVISAVGHEIDYTISDFAADLRAPTPSAAAELVVGRKEAFEDKLLEQRRRLASALQGRLLQLRNRFVAAGSSYAFKEPGHLLRRYRERLGVIDKGLGRELRTVFQQRQQRLDELNGAMVNRMQLRSTTVAQELRRLREQLQALSPTGVLGRGYSITRGPDGAILRDASSLHPGDRLLTRLAHGSIESEINSVQPGDDHGENAREG